MAKKKAKKKDKGAHYAEHKAAGYRLDLHRAAYKALRKLCKDEGIVGYEADGLTFYIGDDVDKVAAFIKALD